jgi:hypothetical protein
MKLRAAPRREATAVHDDDLAVGGCSVQQPDLEGRIHGVRANYLASPPYAWPACWPRTSRPISARDPTAAQAGAKSSLSA